MDADLLFLTFSFVTQLKNFCMVTDGMNKHCAGGGNCFNQIWNHHTDASTQCFAFVVILLLKAATAT